MSLATLTTLISNRLQRLSELFSANRAPSGYRPGVTLEYVRRNLGLASFHLDGARPGKVFAWTTSAFRSTWPSAPKRNC